MYPKKKQKTVFFIAQVWLFCAGPSLERARPLVAGLKKSNVEAAGLCGGPWKPVEPRKQPLLLSIDSWFVYRDPYNGLL